MVLRTTIFYFSLVFLPSFMPSGVAAQNKKTHGPEWGYSGSDGPDHWGSLTPDFAPCKTGRRQSPIDIVGAHSKNLPPIVFDYKPEGLKVIDNGHTIQVNFDRGNSITIGTKRFNLIQLHFHHPSEEQIGGRSYDMVIHLVHSDDGGNLAVIAVLLTKGKSNAMVQSIWEHLPEQKRKESLVSGVEINPAKLLPTDREYYAFSGSLTTPPCKEGVSWFVLKTPTEVSPAEITHFAMRYPNNARPVQPLYGREVLQAK